jgi:hypothetical protein
LTGPRRLCKWWAIDGCGEVSLLNVEEYILPLPSGPFVVEKLPLPFP